MENVLLDGARIRLIDLMLIGAGRSLTGPEEEQHKALWDSASPEFRDEAVQTMRVYTSGGD